MRDDSARSPRSQRHPSRRLSGLFLLLSLGLAAGLAACTPADAGTPLARPQAYTFYLDPWAEGSAETGLVPLDPDTLEAQPGGETLPPVIVSADGSTGVEVQYPEGRASRDPEDIWIVVYDLPGGDERIRFHPPVRALVSGLSGDGARLLLHPDHSTYAPADYPPPVDWYVVDTTSGKLVAHVEDEENACFRQRALIDPAGKRLYCAAAPVREADDAPVPMRLVAYDVESGQRTETLELPQVRIGGAQIEVDGQRVLETLEPAVALSPDGRQLAVAHADADRMTLVDAASLTVEKTISMARPSSLWDRLGLAPGVALAKGPMQGTIRHAAFGPDGRYLYVFSQEMWVQPEDAPDERGLRLLDLERGAVVAEALPEYQIQWVQPAPDGSVYVFGTAEEGLLPYEIRSTSPSMLWRLDGRTLEILAERAFTGYQAGNVVPTS